MKLQIIIVILLIISAIPVAGFTASENGMPRSYPGTTVEDHLLWYPQVQLTWLGSAEHPKMAWANGTYNVVWQDNRNGNWDIYYLRLNPWGFKIVNDTRITSYSGNDTNPALAVRGDYIYVVWQRFTNSHWAIYFARLLYSNKNITIDVAPRAITTTSDNCTNPEIAIGNQGFVHVVWQEFTNKWIIMYDKLNSAGTPVFAPITVSSIGNSTRPTLALTPDNGVEIVWESYSTTPGYSLMYRGLDCCGYHTTPIRRISVVSPHTELSVSYNNNVQVVFSGKRENMSYEIIYTELNKTGVTLVDDTNLTAIDGINSSAPTMVSLRDRLFVAWQEPDTIKFGEYTLTGNIIEKPMCVSAPNASSPTLAVGTNTLGVVWLQKSGNNTVLSMRAARIPDLSVSSVRAMQTGKMISVNVTVKNNLDVNITSAYSIEINGTPVLNGTVNITNTQELHFLLKASPGLHTIQFIINPRHRIYETTYDNNLGETSVFLKHYSFSILAQRDYYMTANGTNISVGVLNTGNCIDNYTITVENISPILHISPNRVRFNLTPGKIQYANFTVSAPPTILYGNYTVQLNVSSESNISENITLKMHVLPRVDFTLHYLQTQYVSPGAEIHASIEVTNLGNCNDTYTLDLSTSAPWPVSITNTTLFLNPGNSSSFLINIDVPEAIPAFSQDVLHATVYSGTENRSVNGTIYLVVTPVHAVDVYVVSSTYVGGAYNVSLSVVNRGNLADFYSFSVSGVLANYTVLSNYSALVPMNGVVNITMAINIPHSVPAGSKTVNFEVSAGNITLKEKSITISVPPVYQYSATAKSISTSTLKIELFINNTGNAIETVFIKPSMDANITWILINDGKNYTNETYVVLKPGDSAVVLITTNENLTEGTYKVILSLTSVSAGNMTLEIEAHIGAQSEGILGLIMDNILYIAIAAVAAVLVVIYFLRRE